MNTGKNVVPHLGIKKKMLANGMTILVRETHTVPKVSTQLWYAVGSKDEASHEKGIAHFIEHMIFKGTDKLSESDINMITHKLSGNCNAFTSYDWTGYLFNFPTHHWQAALPIMADCMQNCTFNEEFLKSEMKAVIQELKMYKDNYSSSLIEQMIATIFADHPYHHPIIGYKQDLWSMKRDDLIAFYKKHYAPNNATLIVVGDVDAQEVFESAEKFFGNIPANPDYKKQTYYHNDDIMGTSVTLYRDVKQSMIMLGFVVPGATSNNEFAFDILSLVLADGKSSRLYKKLVDELELVTEIEAFYYDLFDHGIFFIYFQPQDYNDCDTITEIILDEIKNLQQHCVTDIELERARNQATSAYLSMLEDTEKQAYMIGQTYLATGDKDMLSHYLEESDESLKQKLDAILNGYFRPSVMHTGSVLPIVEEDKQYWQQLQEKSDAEDEKVLSLVIRTAPVQTGSEVDTYQAVRGKPYNFPKPTRFELDNGLTVLYYHNPNIPKIEIASEFQTKNYNDPDGKDGLGMFISSMMFEGTKNYPEGSLSEAIEQYGMSVSVSPGSLRAAMLSKDLEKGLEFILELMTQATFDANAIEKIRTQLLADLDNYWDTPSHFVEYLARKEIYAGHPYSKQAIGSFESIEEINRQDMIEYYKKMFSPHGATIAIIGDLANYDLEKIVRTKLGSWTGPIIPQEEFPKLADVTPHVVTYPINRDQIVLAFARPSITREDSNFDALVLFDQILTGGAARSMHSRLFQLREQSGLFYTIGGSLLSHTGKQPGMMFIKTIVSKDRLEEAETIIKTTLHDAAYSVQTTELQEAQDILAHTIIDQFESNQSIASTFLFLERYKLPNDYFDHRAEKLYSISSTAVEQSAQQLLQKNNLVTIKIGRL